MHKARKDRWQTEIRRRYIKPRKVKPRALKASPQFKLDDLLISPFVARRVYDPDTGRAAYRPIARNTAPSGIRILDSYLQWIYGGGGMVKDFCNSYGLRLADLEGLIFCLTGMRGADFRLTYQMRLADQLLRYTSLELKEVARVSGIGSAVNLFLSYQREYNYAPGERRRLLRQEGDEGRYQIDPALLKSD